MIQIISTIKSFVIYTHTRFGFIHAMHPSPRRKTLPLYKYCLKCKGLKDANLRTDSLQFHEIKETVEALNQQHFFNAPSNCGLSAFCPNPC